MRSVSFLEPTSDVRFAYELAEHLHKTVAELADQMGTVEFMGWKAYMTVKNHESEVEQGTAALHG